MYARLERFSVREWGGVKYLSMGKDSEIVTIDDIEGVKTVDNDDNVIEDAQIVAVSQLDRYKSRLQ